MINAEQIKPVYPVEVAIACICAQHRNFGRVLAALESQATALAESGCGGDIALIEAMLHYADIFAGKIHHPAEEKYLFPVMQQSGAPAEILDTVLAAHGTCTQRFAALLNSFQTLQTRLAGSGLPFLAQFLDVSRAFVSFEKDHMAYEETVVLPCAVELLSAEDWALIAHNFGSQHDPLFGDTPAAALQQLRAFLQDQPALH